MRFLYSALCLIGIAVVQCVIISNSRFADSLPWSGYSESLPHPASAGDRPYSASHTQGIRTKHHQHEALGHSSSSRHLHSSSKSHPSKYNSKYDDNNNDRENRKQEKKQKKKLKQEQKHKQKHKQVADEAQAAEHPSPSTSPHPRKPLYQPYELPNKRLSRGAVFLNATSNVVCTPGYTHQIANFTDAQQNDVLNRYGLPSIHQGYCSGEGGCKIDHVIPIEIGGSNDITNLWPQPYFGEWNAHLKDDLEMFLYKGICNGTINQRHAQKEMRKNWIKAYRKYMVVRGNTNTTAAATKWHTNYYDDDDDDDVEQEKKENEKEEEEKKKKKKKTKKNKKKENKKDKDDDDDEEEEDDDDKEEKDDDDDDDGDAHKSKRKDKDDDDLDEDEDEDDDDDDDFLHHHGSATGNNSNQSANSTSNSSGTATPIIDTTGIDKYLTPASDSTIPSVTGEPSSSLEAPPDHTLPNKQYTTGAVFPDATPSVVCVPGYTKKVRNVTEAEKKKVYAEYGLPGNNQGFCQGPQGCEIDHLIPLEIGGSNDITNLWPQPYFGDWNAHIKDDLENFLRKGICDNSIDQKQAQKDIASNWQTAYNKYMKGQ